MKKARSESKKKWSLPISQKFYEDICRRLLAAASIFFDSEQLYLQMKGAIDSYLTTGYIPTKLNGIDCLLTFTLLKPDIDRAIARSRKARESAARRREAKAAALQAETEVLQADRQEDPEQKATDDETRSPDTITDPITQNQPKSRQNIWVDERNLVISQSD